MLLILCARKQYEQHAMCVLYSAQHTHRGVHCTHFCCHFCFLLSLSSVLISFLAFYFVCCEYIVCVNLIAFNLVCARRTHGIPITCIRHVFFFRSIFIFFVVFHPIITSKIQIIHALSHLVCEFCDAVRAEGIARFLSWL